MTRFTKWRSVWNKNTQKLETTYLIQNFPPVANIHSFLKSVQRFKLYFNFWPSSRIFKLFYTNFTGWLKCLNQEAPQINQKAPKKAPKFFSPKSACILVKSTTDLTPQTIFIAFLCIKVFQLDIFLKIIYVIFETLFSFYLFCVK